MASACPALQCLELLKLTTSSQSLFQPLSLLPGLATLRLVDVAWMADAAVLASLRHETGLTSLEISAPEASHNRDLNTVLPHLEQLSGLRSLSLSLASESFCCDLFYDDAFVYVGADLDGLDVLGQLSSLWGLTQLTHLFWGCPSSGRGDRAWREPGSYEDFNFSEADDIFVLSNCTQLVSLHLACAWISCDAADLLMDMPQLEMLAVHSFTPEMFMLIPAGTCHFKSLALNSCGPSCHTVTRLAMAEISDLPLSDLEEIILCSGKLKLDIEGFDDVDGNPYTLGNRIVDSIRDLAYCLRAGCNKQAESPELSLIITTTAAQDRRFTPLYDLLSPWSILDSHLQSLWKYTTSR